MKALRIPAFATVLLSTLACTSDMMAPSAAEPIALGGRWFYRAPSLAGTFMGEEDTTEDITCVYNFQMRLTQSGEAFGGTYTNALLTCMLFGDNLAVDGGGGSIVAGSRAGASLQFDVDTENIRNTGTISPTGMRGEVKMVLVVQRFSVIDTVLITGPWTATR